MHIVAIRRSTGFTIVELLVVIVVIGILAAAIIISYTGISQKAIVASLKSDLSVSSRTLKMYYTDNGQYPHDLALANGRYCPTTPSDDRYCIKASSGNEFSYYSPPPSYNTFSLQSANNGVAYGVLDNSAISIAAPVTVIASIAGDIGYGGTALAGATTPSDAAVAYQWKIATTVGGTYNNIAGATSSSYTPSIGDVGKFLKVVATGVNFTSGVVTSSASPALVTFAPNGNYYLSGDNTLRAGTDVTTSGATYSTFRTEWDAPNVSYHCGGDPNKEVLSDRTGIRFYMDVCDPLWDYSFLLQSALKFKPSSNVTIYLAGLVEDCFYDTNDGDVCTYSVPSGVAGSYVTVN